MLVPGGAHVRAAVDRHVDRFDALRWLWRHSRLDAVRSCRRAGMTTRGGKVVSHHSVERRPDHSIHVTGLRTCGSVWACPCCSSLIARRRADDIQTAVETALSGGWSVAFLTVTLSHDKRHSLESSWDALTSAWSRSVQGPAWRDSQQFAGVMMPSFKDPSVLQSRIPAIRSMETTITEAGGWHPHLHVLLFTRRGETREETEAIQRRVVSGGPASRGIVGRFRAQLAKSGRRLADQGWNLQHIHDESDVRAVMGDYISKTFFDSLGLELGSAATKRGWGGSMTPFELLAKLASGERGQGYYAARRLWVEWEQTSKGRRQIVWSRNLRLALGMGDELDDREISEERWGLLPGAVNLADKPHYVR